MGTEVQCHQTCLCTPLRSTRVWTSYSRCSLVTEIRPRVFPSVKVSITTRITLVVSWPCRHHSVLTVRSNTKMAHHAQSPRWRLTSRISSVGHQNLHMTNESSWA